VVAASSSGGFWMILACLAGVGIGLFLFFNGFRMLRYKRLILNTPLSKIHSASIGLVELTGTPTGPKTLSAPVTGEPCFYYRVQAWQWEESGKEHQWKQVLDESLYLPFFLEDSTGRVLIDPQGAQMDLHRSFKDEIGASIFRTRELLPANVLNFLVNRGLVPYEKIKIEERIIQPGFPLFVFGTLGDNPSSCSWVPLPHLAGHATSSFNIQFTGWPGPRLTLSSTKMGSQPRPLSSPLVNTLSHVPGVHVERTEMQVPIAGGQPAIPPRATGLLNGVGLSTPAGVLTKSFARSATTIHTTSHGLNDLSFDLHPSSAISKGERSDPFTISYQSQKEVVQSLAWKSTLYIWGGPVLAIASFYFLLLFWGFVSL
jgi:hypothetical protein